MHKKFLPKFLFTLIILVAQSIVLLHCSPIQVQAQASGLTLITPYYGNKEIRSYFDHSLPTYGNNNDYFVRYDGEKWDGNVEIENCTASTNCYDGHNGIDVAMVYEPVLASASGSIWEVGWTSCHNCGYGLQIISRHIIGNQVYLIRYAHLTTVAVEVGQVVKAGQILGTSGSTGNSTGPHLHFDVSQCINTICDDLDYFRPIDPFGWQPEASAPVQSDPWSLAEYQYGADSWCMWGDGEFVNICDNSKASNPIRAPRYGAYIVVDDTVNNTNGFAKGYHANLSCTGIDPNCPEWWETSGPGIGWGNHSYRTLTNGWDGEPNIPDSWAKWQSSPPISGDFEIFVYVPGNLGVSNDSFTWQAHYSIVDSTGIPKKAIVDEYIGAGQSYNPRDKWLSLGIYSLNDNSAVYLLDDGEQPYTHCPNGALLNGNYWCRVAADAVKFVEVIHDLYVPIIERVPLPTPVPNTPTPAITPTTNPALSICEPNESVSQWVINHRSLTTSAMEYYLFPINGETTDADVFRFAYTKTGSGGNVVITFHLQSIPNNYPYRFEVFDGSGNWIDNSNAEDDHSQSYIVYPDIINGTIYYYIRVYSENESLGMDGYTPYDTYSIKASVSSVIYAPGYP